MSINKYLYKYIFVYIQLDVEVTLIKIFSENRENCHTFRVIVLHSRELCKEAHMKAPFCVNFLYIKILF